MAETVMVSDPRYLGQTRGSIHAYRLDGSAPIPPLPVADMRLALLTAEYTAALTTAMAVPKAEVQRRLDAGGIAALALLSDNTIAGYGWVSFDAARVYELRVEIWLPRQHAYIWDCETLPPYRGRHIFPALLRYLLEELRHRQISQVWAAVAPGNNASLHSFARASFRLVAEMEFSNGTVHAFPTDQALPPELAAMRKLNAGC